MRITDDPWSLVNMVNWWLIVIKKNSNLSRCGCGQL